MVVALMALPACGTLDAAVEALTTGSDAVAYNSDPAALPDQSGTVARPKPADANEFPTPKAQPDKTPRRPVAKRRPSEPAEPAPATGPSAAETLAAAANAGGAAPEPLQPAQPAAQPAAVEQPPPEPEPPSNLPSKLVGLNESQLVAVLGTPTESETRAPGKVWHYRKANCTLSISLYPEVQSQTFRSLAYEVTSNDDSASRKRDCLRQYELSALAR
ncbi:MAG: hypothetical protein IT562_24135 [Alphaproteobacteria bacterium]|nr:hypothetical protein [Alphaproteobacteria bacterium]